ncbi:MAG: hypothetical protein H8D23_15925 [Candidatus Brocadiales bacterium]|nr:hypothetical protein [Candidatus Brocadiales bacterium]
MKKFNYVVACWAGDRRRKDPAYDADKTFYIKAQLKQLTKLKHSLDQITFVVNDAPEQAEFVKYLNRMPDNLNGVPIIVLHRPNIGMSYGAWAHTYEKYGREFENYIIMEDDYMPCIDNFDTELFDMMIDKKVDYLCSVYTDHAACAGGIMYSQTIQAIYAQGKTLPYDKGKTPNYSKTEVQGQVGISRVFTDLGYKVADYLSKYNMVFETIYDGPAQYKIVGDPEKPPLMIPVNYLKELGEDL